MMVNVCEKGIVWNVLWATPPACFKKKVWRVLACEDTQDKNEYIEYQGELANQGFFQMSH